MLAFSTRKTTQCLFLIVLSTSVSTLALANTNDLLRIEQWGIESNIEEFHVAAQIAGALPNRGTCASNPAITGDTYTCEKFTAPAIYDIDLNVYEGWNLIADTQQQVIIGLIDTGIDYLHPDIREKVWLNPGEALGIDGNGNGIDDGCEDQVDLDNNGYLDDCHGINTQVDKLLPDSSLNPAAGDPIDHYIGHGTNMAGVLGAEGNNNNVSFHGGVVGITGVHSNIRIATCAAANLYTDVYVTIPNLGGAYGTHDDILECIDYFLSLKQRGENIVVINGSGGASEFNNLYNIFLPRGLTREKYHLNTPAMSAAIQALADQDINMVVAAGNNAWNIDESEENAYYPAAFTHNNIIAVGAINNQGKRWKNSSYGRWSVDVFAPGERILSTNPRLEITQDPAMSDYIVSDGTSQATAFVSGMIALARSNAATQHLSASALRRLIISSGKTLDDLENKSVSGKLARLADDNSTGFLNCEDQLFQRRHWPQESVIQKLPGEWLTLEIARYNCASPDQSESVWVEIQPSREWVELFDNGLYPDKKANDGIFTNHWQATDEYDVFELNFGQDSVSENDDIITVNTSIIVDNLDRNTLRKGSWWSSIFRPGFYGDNYRYAQATKDREFTWTPSVTKAGYYEVFAHWPKHRGYTTHAEYHIQHGDQSNLSTTIAAADQSTNGGQWNSLGVFWFDVGDYPISLTNKNITATVVADAIKLKPRLDLD
ncbi:MAG: S8 family serine peptidase [Pseudomonadales bacterium]|nr:S8 family serine peptidase [Pseudomonadales bacterium]